MSGTLPDELARAVGAWLEGLRVALGFECPLFVPVPRESIRLGKARVGEGTRAWSAGAGTGSLATGLVQAVWVLREIRNIMQTEYPIFVNWGSFAQGESGLFWEAFVSGPGKREGHVKDAEAALDAFLAALPDPSVANAVSCEEEVYSLAGAAALRAGWSSEIALLSEPCLVIKTEAFT